MSFQKSFTAQGSLSPDDFCAGSSGKCLSAIWGCSLCQPVCSLSVISSPWVHRSRKGTVKASNFLEECTLLSYAETQQVLAWLLATLRSQKMHRHALFFFNQAWASSHPSVTQNMLVSAHQSHGLPVEKPQHLISQLHLENQISHTALCFSPAPSTPSANNKLDQWHCPGQVFEPRESTGRGRKGFRWDSSSSLV